MDEAALAGEGMVIGIKEPAATGGIPVGALEDGQLKAAVRRQQAGDARRVIGGVRLEFPGVQGLSKGLARQQSIPDGVGLVTVGDHQSPAYLADGVVDDQAGVRIPSSVGTKTRFREFSLRPMIK